MFLASAIVIENCLVVVVVVVLMVVAVAARIAVGTERRVLPNTRPVIVVVRENILALVVVINLNR
jgi:hypothetical protein